MTMRNQFLFLTFAVVLLFIDYARSSSSTVSSTVTTENPTVSSTGNTSTETTSPAASTSAITTAPPTASSTTTGATVSTGSGGVTSSTVASVETSSTGSGGVTSSSVASGGTSSAGSGGVTSSSVASGGSSSTSTGGMTSSSNAAGESSSTATATSTGGTSSTSSASITSTSAQNMVDCFNSTCAGEGCVANITRDNGTCKASACKLQSNKSGNFMNYTMSCFDTNCPFLKANGFMAEKCCTTSYCNNNTAILIAQNAGTVVSSHISWGVLALAVTALSLI